MSLVTLSFRHASQFTNIASIPFFTNHVILSQPNFPSSAVALLSLFYFIFTPFSPTVPYPQGYDWCQKRIDFGPNFIRTKLNVNPWSGNKINKERFSQFNPPLVNGLVIRVCGWLGKNTCVNFKSILLHGHELANLDNHFNFTLG